MILLTIIRVTDTLNAQGNIPNGHSEICQRLHIDSVFFIADTSGVTRAHADYILLGVFNVSCKSRVFEYGKRGRSVPAAVQLVRVKAKPAKAPFIAMHGRVMYDGFFQSNMDTPYLARNLYQHTLTVGVDIKLKDNYPLKLYFTSKFSNASFIKNITDLGFQFNNQAFENEIYQKVEAWAIKQVSTNDSIRKLDSALLSDQRKLDSLRGLLSNPSLLQQLIEQRERAWLAKKVTNYLKNDSSLDKKDSSVRRYDSLTSSQMEQLGSWRPGQTHFDYNDGMMVVKRWVKADSSHGRVDTSSMPGAKKAISYDSTFADSVAKKRHTYDSIQHRTDSLERVRIAEINKWNRIKDSVINKLAQAKTPGALSSALDSMHLPDSLLPARYKKLLALKSFSVGRSNVNFSELSVNGISLEGVQAEYNPSWYLAFAAGTVNYRFRDFILNDNSSQQQYVAAVRAGTGTKKGRHFFVTFYTGKKQTYNYATDSAGNILPGSPGNNLMGVTLEKKWQLDKTTTLTAEVAKSSSPYYSDSGEARPALAHSVLDYRDRANEAYSVKIATLISTTRTKIDATFKRLGADFQSFSLFTSSSAQTAWAINAEQPFFKRQLVVDGAIKENDFNNPYINVSNYSKVVFKSISATLRKKRWPVLSVSYSPSAQLTSLGNGQFTENLFNTLTGTASWAYKWHGLMMSSVFSYMRFYNKASDSGFAYFNTQNLLIGQSILLKRFTIQGDISVAENSSYDLYSADGNVQIKLLKWLTVGGGMKYIVQTGVSNQQTGYSTDATIQIHKLGNIQFLFQKTYIPGMNMELVENSAGRLVYTKIF